MTKPTETRHQPFPWIPVLMTLGFLLACGGSGGGGSGNHEAPPEYQVELSIATYR